MSTAVSLNLEEKQSRGARPNGADALNHGTSMDKAGGRGTLTRQDIALALHHRFSGMSRREAKLLTDIVIEEMAAALATGETLKLHDFGSFVVRAKRERAGRNPRTGAPVSIGARRVVVFKPSINMKATVNGELPARGAKRARRRSARADGCAVVAETPPEQFK